MCDQIESYRTGTTSKMTENSHKYQYTLDATTYKRLLKCFSNMFGRSVSVCVIFHSLKKKSMFAVQMIQ